jgi:hypothetical protein
MVVGEKTVMPTNSFPASDDGKDPEVKVIPGVCMFISFMNVSVVPFP